MSRRSLVVLFALALVGSACQTEATNLKTGDCFDGGDGTEVATVTPVECAKPHQKEVFASFDYPDPGSYPGEPVLTGYAREQCPIAFEAYVGKPYDDSELFIIFLTPSTDTWSRGDRLVSCILHAEDDAPLTGSMKGSQR